jgi:DNA invertase Pin-like site-specific DNA recombinase
MLKDSKVDFVACDIPDANTLTIGIFAVVAQHEREIISRRIKEALAAKKARGFKLGMPENLQPKDRLKGLQTRILNARANRNNLQASETIKHLRKGGDSFMAIASRLNELEYTTRRGKSFYPITVQRLYERSR